MEHIVGIFQMLCVATLCYFFSVTLPSIKRNMKEAPQLKREKREKKIYENLVKFINLKNNDPQYERRISVLTKLISLDPHNGTHYYNRGVFYGYLGEDDEALADYNRALELNPNDIEALGNRASIFVNMKEWEKAVVDCERCVEISPNCLASINLSLFIQFREEERLKYESFGTLVPLHRIEIAKNKVIRKIESNSKLVKNPNITEILALNKNIYFVKGTFYFNFNDGEANKKNAYLYPFFGIHLINDKKFLVQEFHRLLQVLVDDQKYHLITYWQKPESGGRGTIVYALENGSLIKVSADYSDGT